MGYEYYNANVKGNFVNDCVVRAISTAEDKSWKETYQELSQIAGQQGILLDDVNFVEPLLDSRYERTCEKKKTVGEFSEEHPTGTYLITMARSHYLPNRTEKSLTLGIAGKDVCGVRGELNKRVLSLFIWRCTQMVKGTNCNFVMQVFDSLHRLQ